MNTRDLSTRLDHAKSGLLALLQHRARNSPKTIKETLELLDYFDLLQDSVNDLWFELSDNNAFHLKNLMRFSDDKHGCDLVAAVLAIDAVISFLRFSPSMSLSTADRRKRFKILDELRQALR